MLNNIGWININLYFDSNYEILFFIESSIRISTKYFARLQISVFFYIFSIAFKVILKNPTIDNIIVINNIVVCGRFNKFKKGPMIVKINPSIDEMKNLGNLIIFSQKFGIFYVRDVSG